MLLLVPSPTDAANGRQEPATAPRLVPRVPFPTVTTSDGRIARADQFIVGFTPHLSNATRTEVHREIAAGGASTHVVASLSDSTDVVAFTGASLSEVVRVYRADPRVRYAEPDYVVHALAAPNDPAYPLQWALPTIQAPAAWDVTHGQVNVVVAVLDSGIFDEASGRLGPDGVAGHPDLRGKVVADHDFTGDATTDDQYGHGTQVAGLVAADTNNGIGIAGVGYDTRILNGRILNAAGSGSESWIAAGIHWATDQGARVINLSLGSAGNCSSTLQDAVSYAWLHGVVIVAAAGNGGTATPETPADCPNVMAVASTDANDSKSGFSSYGTWVHVAAPGGYDANYNGIYATRTDGTYGYFEGTSAAAAEVSGLAALLWATSWGTNNQAVVARIEETADGVGGTGTFWRNGRVNALRAVSGAPTAPPSSSPTASPSTAPTATATTTPRVPRATVWLPAVPVMSSR